VAIEGLSIRLYADHNFDDRFSVDLRRDGFDLVLAREVGNQRLSDEDHLAWATAQDRVILTHDVKDFFRLARTWHLAGRPHSGIILSAQPGEQMPYGTLLRRLLRLLDTLTAEDMINRVEWLYQRWDNDEGHD
jgi:predicted nuclease of predicted toxin-antitoxin system